VSTQIEYNLNELDARNVDTLPKNIRSNKKTFLPDTIDWSNIQKAKISLKDSLLWVYQNIRKDYRIIGYEEASIKSKPLILFSVFTQDVENNPYGCYFGAFYSTSDLRLKDVRIKFKAIQGQFVKTNLIINNVVTTSLYFERKWIAFSK
jgi:hypothetical protein